MNNNSLRFKGFFSNMTPNKKSNTKLANDFFGTFIFPIHPEVRIIHEIVIFFLIFENKCFTLSSSSSSSIYNIVIAINTPIHREQPI